MKQKTERAISRIIAIFFIIGYLQVVAMHIAITNQISEKFQPFWNSVIWLYKARNNEVLFQKLASSFIIFSFILFLGIMACVFYKWKISNKKYKNLSLHGSARWATLDDVRGAGLLSPTGVIVGGFEHKGKSHYLVHDGTEHIITYAPTRSGKGVSLIIPTMLTWRNSVAVTDIKGELFYLTAGFRKNHMNQKIIKFEPSTLNSAKWNPFDEVRVGTINEVSDVQTLALTIIDPNGEGLKDHWAKSAYSVITGCILYLLERRVNGEGCASMQALDQLISDPSRPLSQLWEEMKTAQNLLVRQVGQDMIDKPENEAGSIISTAKTELIVYRDPVVAMNTSFSNFSVFDLMNYDTPVSLYIITSPQDIGRLRPLIRLLINMLVRVNVATFEFTRTDPKKDTWIQKVLKLIKGKSIKNYHSIRGKGSYKHRLLLMLDEFTSLGKIGIIQEALAYMAGYGIKVYLITQDLAQLHETYGANESITGNSHIQNAYSPNNPKTAEHLSKLVGETTIIEERVSSSQSGFLGKTSYSKNYDHVKRPLITPDECRSLRGTQTINKKIIPGEMLIFVAGFPPIKGVQKLYYQDDKFIARSSIQAPEKSDVIYSEMKFDNTTANSTDGKNFSIEDIKPAVINNEE